MSDCRVPTAVYARPEPPELRECANCPGDHYVACDLEGHESIGWCANFGCFVEGDARECWAMEEGL